MGSHLSTVLLIGLFVGVPFLLTRNFTLNRLRPEEDGSGFVHESKSRCTALGHISVRSSAVLEQPLRFARSLHHSSASFQAVGIPPF